MVMPKPVKFAISIALLLVSMRLILPTLSVSPRTRDLLWLLLWTTMAIEMFVIVVQAVRGEKSHFNTSTPVNRAGWALMMIAIVVTSVVFVVVAVIASVGPVAIERPALLWAVRIGLWLLASSALSGFAMGGRNQHAVGGSDGGPGLPVVGFSTRVGDLRVSHFFALHGLQLLAVVAVVADAVDARAAVVVVVAVGAACCAATTLTLGQALRGRPLWSR